MPCPRSSAVTLQETSACSPARRSSNQPTASPSELRRIAKFSCPPFAPGHEHEKSLPRDGCDRQTSSMPDGVVRWPDHPVTQGRVAVVTVSYNTRELTALMLWSLRRILQWESLEIVVVDNGSKDGSAELLAKIDAAGGCRLIPNAGNAMHGPALTQAMSFLASRGSELPQWVWVLDS